MKKNIIFYLGIILYILSAVMLIFTIKMHDKISYLQDCERITMRNESMLNQTHINGYYRSNKFYCVWIEGRTEADINRTDAHEICHHYIYTNKEHFCNGGVYKYETK